MPRSPNRDSWRPKKSPMCVLLFLTPVREFVRRLRNIYLSLSSPPKGQAKEADSGSPSYIASSEVIKASFTLIASRITERDFICTYRPGKSSKEQRAMKNDQ